MNVGFDIPDCKKIRVIVDTDAACEADDPFAIVHALLSPKLIVKGVVAEHFGVAHSMEDSLREIETIKMAIKTNPSIIGKATVIWIGTQGESWSLGDSPAIALAINPGCGHYKMIKAPTVADDTSSVENVNSPTVRLYTDVDSRYILEDLIAKLELFNNL